MRYRWKRNRGDENEWRMYLILDGTHYEALEVIWYDDRERWKVYVSGFVCEDVLDLERTYFELLSDAKKAALNFMRVWWVSGVMQRMPEKELDNWKSIS